MDYLQSTGTQYINTNFIPKTKYKYILDFQYLDVSGNPASIVGGRPYSNMWESFGANEVSQFAFGVPTSSSNYSWKRWSGSNTNRHTFTYDWFNLKGTLDSSDLTFSDYFNSWDYPIYLFAASNLLDSVSSPNAKIYSFKIYSSETVLVRDFIPVVRVSDIAIGMYDKVTETFFANAGSGTFDKGNIIGKIY